MRTAPAAERNKGAILAVLARVLSRFAGPDPRRPALASAPADAASAARRARGLVLEIASGTGQHVVHFAKALPALDWQPSEFDAAMLPSIASWIESEGLANVRPPLALDVGRHPWPVARADAIVCINMIHISPWQATLDLIAGAARILGANGVLFLYGPYRRFGAHTAPSNEAFDADLRARNAEWGVRDLEAVEEIARGYGFVLNEAVAMPANNFSVVFRKT